MEETLKATIIYDNDTYRLRYFDKNGTELKPGDKIIYDDGTIEELHLTEEDRLGTDATNKAWIADGRALPCEYGVYPLEREEMGSITKYTSD